MSNLCLYSDYNGPRISIARSENDHQDINKNDDDDKDNDDEHDNNPLHCGLWMEGDSLAPPCGSSISFIRSMLSIAKVTSEDVLYDLGCGDGRICFEALTTNNCRHCVGIEIEHDLVDKANMIISRLPEKYQQQNISSAACHRNEEVVGDTNIQNIPRIQILQNDLRECLGFLVEAKQRSKRTTTQNRSVRDVAFAKLPMPTIIVLYLLPESIRMIEEKLVTLLDDGATRIVCIGWGLSSVKESESIEVYNDEEGTSTNIYLYDKR